MYLQLQIEKFSIIFLCYLCISRKTQLQEALSCNSLEHHYAVILKLPIGVSFFLYVDVRCIRICLGSVWRARWEGTCVLLFLAPLFYSTKDRQSMSLALLQVTNKPKPTSRLNIYFNNSYAFLIEVAGKKQSS